MAGSGTDHLRVATDTVLRAENLVMEFPVGNAGLKVHAVSDVSIDVREGETLGLVGESGCGKSTTGKAMMQLPRPTSGAVLYNGQDLTQLSGSDLRKVRPDMQMIFQDPISSLNPRRRVKDIVAEPLRIWISEGIPMSSPVALAVKLLKGAAYLAALLAVLNVAGWFVMCFVKGWTAFFTMMIAGVLLALAAAVPWGISQMIQARTALSRPVLLGWIAIQVLLGLWINLGVEDISIKFLVFVALPVLLEVAALLMSLAGQADFSAVAKERKGIADKVSKALEDVGIDPVAAWRRRPHQFSGGQCQRICIARALVLDPKLIICDEPVSALDVSVQAQILNLLEAMKERYNLTLVFIAHDLAVVKNVSDRVAVMYLGKLCEIGPPDDLYARPAHPYTAALLSSIPVPDPSIRPREEATLGGELPSPVAPPSGCRFRTRCPRVQDKCAQIEPKIRQIGLGHYVACHFPLDDTSVRPGVQAAGRH